MSQRLMIIIVAVLFGLVIISNLLVAPVLPATVASHWNAEGSADGYQSKAVFLWTMPAIIAFTMGILIFLPNIDPRKKDFLPSRKTYNFFVIGIMLFLIYMHGSTLLYNLGYPFNFNMVILPAMGLLFIGTGFMTEKARFNWFVGIRTPWTMSNPVVWNKTHQIGGLLFKIVGGITLLCTFWGEYGFLIMLVSVLGISFFLYIYSYVLYKQEEKKIQ